MSPEQVYERMKASGCHTADTCVMDPACPFAADCRSVEDACEPEPLAVKSSATALIPQALLEDLGAMDDMSDLLGKALRGEIHLKPPPDPERHRCVLCWLLAKLPGHDRCDHGRLNCDDCYSDS